MVIGQNIEKQNHLHKNMFLILNLRGFVQKSLESDNFTLNPVVTSQADSVKVDPLAQKPGPPFHSTFHFNESKKEAVKVCRTLGTQGPSSTLSCSCQVILKASAKTDLTEEDENKKGWER